MSISVTPNGDGTITVECGGASIVIGAPAPKKPDDPSDIPILWPPGGATANIIASKKAKVIDIEVETARHLAEAIREQHKQFDPSREGMMFHFNVRGLNPMNVEELNKTLDALGHPEWMGITIKLLGNRDD